MNGHGKRKNQKSVFIAFEQKIVVIIRGKATGKEVY
jgi:hypothetical protein